MSTMPIKCDGIIGCEWSHEISVFAIFVCRKKDYVQNIPHNHPNHTIPWHCIGIANVTKSTFAHQVWCTNFSVLGKTSVTKMCVWMCQTFTAGQRTLACGYWGCGQQGQQTEYALETLQYVLLFVKEKANVLVFDYVYLTIPALWPRETARLYCFWASSFCLTIPSYGCPSMVLQEHAGKRQMTTQENNNLEWQLVLI